MKARRKFILKRSYPRGIECDDAQTSAEMGKGYLTVEMPIVKLPPVTTDGLAKSSEAKSEPPKKKHLHNAELDIEEQATAVTKKAKGKKRAVPGDEAEKSKDFKLAVGGGTASVDGPKKSRSKHVKDTSEAEVNEPTNRLAVVSGKRKKSGSVSEERILEILTDVSQTEETKRVDGISKVRAKQQKELEREQGLKMKKKMRADEDAKILETFRKQKQTAKKVAKRTKKAAVEESPQSSPAQPAKKKKCVSFSPKLEQ